MAAVEAGPRSGGMQHAVIEIHSLFRNIHLVPADVLMQISKTGSLRDFLRSCGDEYQVKRVWDSLFLTLSTRVIPQGHTQAACNAIVLFVQSALSSEISTTRSLVYSHETWLSVFELILTRFDDVTTRTTKQVFSILIKVLKSHPNVDEARLIRVGIRNAIMPSIILADPRSRMKSSLVALERFVREDGLSPSTLMSMVYDWLVANYDKWRPLLAKHCQSLSTDILTLSGTNTSYDDADMNVKQHVSIVFNLALLINATAYGYAQAAGSLIALLYTQAEKTESDLVRNCYPLRGWILPTKHVMLQMKDSLEVISHGLLSSLLGSDIKGFRAFLQVLPLETVLSGDIGNEGTIDEFLLLFFALRIGKTAGFVHEDYIEETKAASKYNAHALVLNSEFVGRFLLHNEAKIRLSALSLLVTAPAWTKPISATALRLILSALPCFSAESDASFRQETLSLTRKLMLRLRGPIAQKDFMEKEGKNAKLFMENYVSFLEGELTPTASYQRHIFALKTISIVINTGIDPNATHVPQKEKTVWRYNVHVLRPSLFRVLVDLLLSPFDEIRGVALSLIGCFPNNIPTQKSDDPANERPTVRGLLITALSRAETLASRTSRADHADTVARLYHALFSMADKVNGNATSGSWFSTKLGVVDEILKRLEKKLFHEAGLFHTSLQDAPLHGHTSALRYIVSTPEFHVTISNQSDKNDEIWRKIHDRIIAVCESTWSHVKPVLCSDSPEGHTDELVDDFMVGPKDVLSYSWRALKDSSLLLHAILSNTTYAPPDSLQRADYETIGALSYVQLSQLRHRGAFTAVSQTFETCCVRCAENKKPEISGLPDLWYQNSLRLIQDQASKLTRRSAGLPALVIGICIAKSCDPLFEKIMNDLQDISNSPAVQAASYDELSLPQVHAMNILCNIFSHAKLTPYTEGYTMPYLKLATDRLSSPIWAIRNCGLMLFHALMNRMCKRTNGMGFGFSGVSGTESNMTISFQKHEGLTQLMAQLLTAADEARSTYNKRQSEKGSLTSDETEKVFPALEIIAEKIPSTDDDDDALLRDLVMRHVKSTIWAVRDQSARVYASLLRTNDILSSINTILDSNVAALSQIYIQGRLLCIRYALLRLWHSDYWRDNLDNILATTRKAFDLYFPNLRSPFGQATLFDVLSDALESIMKSDKEVITKTAVFMGNIFDTYGLEHGLAELVRTGPEGQNRINSMRAESLLRRSLTWCMLLKNSMLLTISAPESSPAKLLGPFFDLSLNDGDAACWILERIRVLFDGYEKQRDFLSLYLLILLQSFHEENIKANAALNLAETLEDALAKGVEVDFLNKWARVSEHLLFQSQDCVWSRQLDENVLRLQGSLLALKYMHTESKSLSGSNGNFESLDLQRWTVSLRSALNEETVYSSRFSAIMSLKAFSHVLRKTHQSADTSPVSLELYVLLYDMLKDDDDELRALSALIASRILSHSELLPNQTVALSAVPASERLAEFITLNYSSQAALYHQVIGRLMGSAFCHQPHTKQPKPDFISFKTLFEDHCKESTVLFEVEKQNLFIDEVREIDTWAKVFRNLDRSVHDKEVTSKLAEWVSEGLEYLNSRIAPSTEGSQEDSVLGLTSKAEVYTLGVLLFNVASLLIFISTEPEMELGRTNGKIISSASLKEALKVLYERGQSMSLHPHWLDRMQAAISAPGQTS